jgi:hypothetical protein
MKCGPYIAARGYFSTDYKGNVYTTSLLEWTAPFDRAPVQVF